MAEKYIFFVIKYPAAATAEQALSAIIDLMQSKTISLKDAVAITKDENGELTLHRMKPDQPIRGFLNGGLIGIIFADLFGSASWELNSALAGTAFTMLGQAIDGLLRTELGEKMTPAESAVVIIIEHADWRKALDSMRPRNFQGKAVISQNVISDLASVEKLIDEKITTAVPEKIYVTAPKGLEYIEGIGKVYSQRLHAAGITNVDELLNKGSTPKGRNEINKSTGISDKLILQWVNHVDLFRIPGVGQEYADLLEAAGVDTIPELAQRVPSNLLEKMTKTNAEKKLVRRLPSLSMVENWVASAKSLPRVITY